ncbi:hypothetical protein [Hubei noda-like virus 17]|uniref:hypothetical protein n=1 Tax=Hubei noda-like virus 17 TaxID=1922972 RepID=UPI00090C3598|nr:hypothetical protein [Hubei noda-like virus 17]APG76284.1 hypothetical protein [Hubei noda-like virus 17]
MSRIVVAAVSAAAITTLTFGCFTVLMRRKRTKAFLASKLQDLFSVYHDPVARSAVIKSFVKQHIGARAGHSHAEAATDRNSATQTMHTAARQLGMQPYVISPSRRESDAMGWRCYFQSNDYGMQTKYDAIPEDACFIMTDVDYYADMPDWLSLARPILMYSFMPTRVAGNVDGSNFTIVNDYVRYRVNGGGDFKHQIWNWNYDTLYVDMPCNIMQQCIRGLCNVFGWGYRRHYFTIDSIAFGTMHNIYVLLPLRTLSIDFLQLGNQLERMQFSDGAFNKLLVNKDGELWVSIAKQGEYTAVDLTINEFEAVSATFSLASKHYLADTLRWAPSIKNNGTASILHCYLNQEIHRPQDNLVFQPGTMSPHYIVDPKPYEEYHFYARDFAPCPLSSPALAPAVSQTNEDVTINERVVKPQLRSGRKTPPRRFVEYANEFIAQLIEGYEHVGEPWQWEDVAELQTRKHQRMRNARSILHSTCDFVVRAFQKKEHYSGISAPRNISTVPSEHTLEYSTFTRSFKDVILKHAHWYVPGSNPEQIAQRVADLARSGDSVLETDFSKFDGHQSAWLHYHVEFPAHYLFFKESYRYKLYELHARELSPKAFTSTGKQYSTEFSRLSGTPNTTDGNTLLNAFFQYATAREMQLSPKHAYQAIGLAYGDDGLMSSVIKPEIAIKTAETIGLPVKTNIVRYGEPVTFLSRVFRDPWVCLSSIQEPKRALAKINSTVHPELDIRQAGLMKVSGYLVTDAYTPVISDWCYAYLRITAQEPTTELAESDANYFAQEYPDTPWPQDSSIEWLDIVANLLGVQPVDINNFIEQCKVATTLDQLPVLTIDNAEHKMDGVIYTSTGSVEISTQTENEAMADTNSQPTTTEGNRDEATADAGSRTLPAHSGEANRSTRQPRRNQGGDQRPTNTAQPKNRLPHQRNSRGKGQRISGLRAETPNVMLDSGQPRHASGAAARARNSAHRRTVTKTQGNQPATNKST